MTALSATDLRVHLRDRLVLEDVTTRFERGRVTALLGPNGAGKTTLLSCLAGLRAPSAGRVRLGDVDVLALDPRARARRIGMLPQNNEVHWDIDVTTLIGLGRFPHRGRWGATAADERAVLRAMAATDVTQFAARSVKQLSGGERSRVLLARVLAGEPEWLLADEPLASLDPAHQLDVLDLLRAAAAAGAGVIVVLHDLTHAARVADDVVLLRDGRVIAHGPRDEVMVEERVREAFGIDVLVSHAANAGHFVVPLRRCP
ncbi:MAG TPA: ABC transporter ATP-binding protein [Steroidobacteraceae bacterium]|nr:ABC transporter ATP-binding protein [Steroidobacteraceae bacterium]